MYYYRVKENTELEKYLTKEEETRRALIKKASSMSKRLGFKAYYIDCQWSFDVCGFGKPEYETDLSKFRKPDKYGAYVPKKRTDIYREMKDFDNSCDPLFMFFMKNRASNTNRYQCDSTTKKPYCIAINLPLDEKWQDQLVEIKGSEFMKRKEED